LRCIKVNTRKYSTCVRRGERKGKEKKRLLAKIMQVHLIISKGSQVNGLIDKTENEVKFEDLFIDRIIIKKETEDSIIFCFFRRGEERKTKNNGVVARKINSIRL
jgi:hypothetical protein